MLEMVFEIVWLTSSDALARCPFSCNVVSTSVNQKHSTTRTHLQQHAAMQHY